MPNKKAQLSVFLFSKNIQSIRELSEIVSITSVTLLWGLYPLNKIDYNPHNNKCQGGIIKMIIFDKLWITMEKKGVTTYKLREECGIDSKTVRRLKSNENIETKTLNKLCSVLDCKIEDIMEYIKD